MTATESGGSSSRPGSSNQSRLGGVRIPCSCERASWHRRNHDAYRIKAWPERPRQEQQHRYGSERSFTTTSPPRVVPIQQLICVRTSLAVYVPFVSPYRTCPAAHPVSILNRCGHLWRAWRSGRCWQIRQPVRAASRRRCAEQSEPAGRGELDPHNILAVGQANCLDARAGKELT
jgi:hypothetical protein